MTRRALVAAGLLAMCLAGPAARAQPPVWLIRGAHARILLFGSVHLLPPALDWRPPALSEALLGADEVWFELPITQNTDAEALRSMRRRGRLPAGDRLSMHLTAVQERLLEREAAGLGLSPIELQPLAPWLAELTLSLAQDVRSGARATLGVEDQIQGLAPPGAKRRAFETPRQQVEFLAGAPLAVQVASLDLAMREIADEPDAYSKLIDAWMAGDLAALQAQALEPLRAAAPVLYRRVITERNRRWAGRLRRQLSGDKTMVVIVGVGHLIGPEGIPALLRARGVQVEGP